MCLHRAMRSLWQEQQLFKDNANHDQGNDLPLTVGRVVCRCPWLPVEDIKLPKLPGQGGKALRFLNLGWVEILKCEFHQTAWIFAPRAYRCIPLELHYKKNPTTTCMYAPTTSTATKAAHTRKLPAGWHSLICFIAPPLNTQAKVRLDLARDYQFIFRHERN
jgi:hypothetical protein